MRNTEIARCDRAHSADAEFVTNVNTFGCRQVGDSNAARRRTTAVRRCGDGPPLDGSIAGRKSESYRSIAL